MKARPIFLAALVVAASSLMGSLGLASPLPPQSLPAKTSSDEKAEEVSSISVIYTAAKKYEGLAWLHGGERFPVGSSLMIHDGKGSHELAKQFAATSDANVSFDGKSVLFSAKQHLYDRWQAWELSLVDNQFKRLTQSPDDIIRPMYLPAGRIVYARKAGKRFVLEALSLADGKVMPLSYAPGNYLPTDVLRDGRVLFESAYPLGTDGAPEIYTVYSDGTGVESYRCDHGPARFAGREVGSGDIVFPSLNGLARFTSPLAHQVTLETPAGDYAGDVAELTSQDWLLARRRSAQQPYQIEKWNLHSKSLQPFLSQPGANLIEPVVVAPRTVPNRHPSTLRDWTAANLLTLDAYTSKYMFKPGSIASVRIYTMDDAGRRRVLGTSPVEHDGSLYVHVPGDVPLQFELLNSAGKTLRKESGWMWTRKSEQRICVGCHAGPERAPENVVPAVLLRSVIPTDMTAPRPTTFQGAH